MNSIRPIITLTLICVFSTVANSDSTITVQQAYHAVERNDLDKAIQLFHIAIRDNSQPIEAKVGLAKCYFRKGLLKRADDLISDVLLTNSSHIDAQIIKGRLYIASKGYESAINVFEAVIQQNPRNLHAQHLLAQALRSDGKNEEAETIYENLKNNQSQLQDQ